MNDSARHNALLGLLSFCFSELVRPKQLPRILSASGSTEKQLSAGGAGESGKLPRGHPSHCQLHSDQLAGRFASLPTGGRGQGAAAVGVHSFVNPTLVALGPLNCTCDVTH